MVQSTVSSSQTAFLLIDIQKGFSISEYWGQRSNPTFEANVTKLLAAFRASEDKPFIIHVAHKSVSSQSPLNPSFVFPPNGPVHPGKKGTDFYDYVAPQAGELILTKNVNSAFIGTSLESELRGRGIRRLYVVGITSDRCVSTTVRMAANLGVCDVEGQKGDVVLIGDATAAFKTGEWDAETVQAVHLATLGDEFCRLIGTKEALDEIGKL